MPSDDPNSPDSEVSDSGTCQPGQPLFSGKAFQKKNEKEQRGKKERKGKIEGKEREGTEHHKTGLFCWHWAFIKQQEGEGASIECEVATLLSVPW